MANTVNLVNYANTFGDWIVATNALARENNDLAANNYHKNAGTLYLDTNSLALQSNGNAVFAQQLAVQGVGSSLYVQHNADVDGQLYLANTQLSLVASGQANVSGPILAMGPGTGLAVSNTATVGGQLYVTKETALSNTLTVTGATTLNSSLAVAGNTVISNTVYVSGTTTVSNTVNVGVDLNVFGNITGYNKLKVLTDSNTKTLQVLSSTVTDSLQSNTVVNTAVLSVTTTGFLNAVQANSSVNTAVLSVTGTSYTDALQANTSANTRTLSVTGVTYTNNLQANTSANTRTLSVTGTSYTDILQANTSANTATLSVTGVTYTNNLQANSSINTVTSSVSGTSYTNNLQANTGVNTSVLSVTTTSYTNNLQANTGVNTGTLSVSGTSYTNILQANTSANTGTLSVAGVTYTNNLQANASINAATSSVSGTSYTNNLQANSSINTVTSSVSGTSYTNNLQANTSANTRTLSVTGTSYTNNLQANTGVNTSILSVSGTSYTNNLQANTGVNTSILSVSGTSFTDVLQANTSANTGTLSVAGSTFTKLLTANSNSNLLGDVVIGNPTGTSANLVVTGNFIINGSTLLDTDRLVLKAVNPQTIGSGYDFIVINRGEASVPANANAQIRWNEPSKYWDLRDVNSGSNYYRIVTDYWKSDSSNLNNSANVASSAAVYSANTWLQSYASNASNLTGGTVAAARLPAFSGDASSSAGSSTLTLATVNSNVGQYGSSSTVPVITVNAKGLVTGITTTNVAGVSGYSYNSANNTFTLTTSAGTAYNATINQVQDFVVSGNLTVSGITTTVNSTTVSVADKNVELGKVASPTDTTADGGGLTLKGTTDKTFNWVSATPAWTSSENLNLLTGKSYKINGTDVLSATGLGSGVVASSLTSVGTITSGTWSGSFGAVSGANLTSLTAGNLTGTIPSGVLGNSTQYIGTTAITLNRASAGQTLTGVSIDGNSATTSQTSWSSLYTTSQLNAQGNQASAIATSSGGLGGIMVQGPNSSSAAFMSFHRPGAYAAYFGLDTDNQWKVGGWSAGAVAYTLLHSGNYNSYAPTLGGTGASGTWGINVTGTAGAVAWGNVTGKPNTSALNFAWNWSGQAGQPTYLWGGSDGTNMYVYNPSNFSVNYANSAGSAPANGGTSSAVTINYGNDSNSTYYMLWGSGNSVYGTGGIYCNPYTDNLYAAAYIDSNDSGYYCNPNGSSRLDSITLSASKGIYWPDNAFGGSGDTASIILTNFSGEAQKMLFTIGNDADDKFYFSAPSNNGLLMNGNVVWNAGNHGSGSGLDADLLRGVAPGSLSVNYANSAGSANAVAWANVSGKPNTSALNFAWNWSGQGGQPSWLWGGGDGTNMYVYNPSNFSVAYAGDAGTVNGWSRDSIRSFGNLILNQWNSSTYLGYSQINTTIFYDSNDSSYYCDPNGTARLNSVDANSLYSRNDITGFSDRSLKTNIQKIDDALNKVNLLNGYTFDRVDLKTTRKTGVIAQEVLEVLPEAVTLSDSGLYTVAYGNMVGLLIESIKELTQQNKELAQRLQILENNK